MISPPDTGVAAAEPGLREQSWMPRGAAGGSTLPDDQCSGTHVPPAGWPPTEEPCGQGPSSWVLSTRSDWRAGVDTEPHWSTEAAGHRRSASRVWTGTSVCPRLHLQAHRRLGSIHSRGPRCLFPGCWARTGPRRGRSAGHSPAALGPGGGSAGGRRRSDPADRKHRVWL